MIGIYNREMFLTDYSATAGRILMIFSAVPHETEEMVKISPMARLRAHARNFCITILAKMWFVFFGGLCFSFGGIN